MPPRLILSALLALWFFHPLLAQEPPAPPAPANAESAPPAVLRIGVVDSLPFYAKTGNDWSGLGVDLWTQVGIRRGIKIEWVPVKYHDVPDLLKSGKIDIGPPSTITARGLKDRNFTVPFIASSLCIVTLPREQSSWRGAYYQFRTSGVPGLLAAILLFNFLIGLLLWLMERKRSGTHFGGEPGQGIGSAIWCAVTTMMTVGYGDKVPITWAGRLLCFVVMLTGVVIISLFTATAGAALTVSHLQGRVNNLSDLRKVKCVASANSPAAEYLKNNGFDAIYTATFAEALQKLASGEATALVHDKLRAQGRLKNSDGLNAVILPLALKEDYYSFTIPVNSPQKGWIDLALQEVLESEAWTRIQDSYLTR